MAQPQPTTPAFTETMQIGIVVRDLDAAVRHYVEDYGIGPWQYHEFKASDFKQWREYGEPASSLTRIAAASVGGVQWELIQPLNDEGMFARFLAEKGEGVHHIAVRAVDYDQTLAAEAERGQALAMDCELDGQFSGIKVAYLDTQPTLGVILEVFNRVPDSPKPPEPFE